MPNNIMSIRSIEQIAEEQGRPLHIVAIESQSPKARLPESWPNIREYDENDRSASVDLIGNYEGDTLTAMAKALSEQIQFPVSTIFLHGLGVLSSAMTKSFKIDYRGKSKPVTMYVVTAQKSSTGKSAINEALSEPAILAYADLNERTKSARRVLQRKISGIEAELDNVKSKLNDFEMQEKEDMLADYHKKLAKIPHWTYFLDDCTIEGAERCAAGQGGMFNILSSEAESISVITGGVYGDGKSKSNFNLLLKAWDGETVSITRGGRDGYCGQARTSIAVIAQAESIDTIMSMGSTGRGIAGRFLMINEPDMLGKRIHSGNSYRKLEQGAKYSYEHMMRAVVNEQNDVNLSLADDAWGVINKLSSQIEPQIAEGGRFDDQMITEFAGKGEKHVIKIASVLHVASEWSTTGNKNTVVSKETIQRAVFIFKVILKNYIDAADKLGYSGINSEINKLCEKIDDYASKNKMKIRVPTLINNLKNMVPFKTSRNLTKRMKTVLLPILQDLNYCYVHDSIIYINPRLK